jgi:beta-galactosidase/beta-glucuronidase
VERIDPNAWVERWKSAGLYDLEARCVQCDAQRLAHEVVIDSRWHYLRGDEVVIVSHWRMTFDANGKLHLAVDGERAARCRRCRASGCISRWRISSAGELAGLGRMRTTRTGGAAPASPAGSSRWKR